MLVLRDDRQHDPFPIPTRGRLWIISAQDYFWVKKYNYLKQTENKLHLLVLSDVTHYVLR